MCKLIISLTITSAFGHPNVSVLDGGLPRWLQLGLPVETTAPAAAVGTPGTFTEKPLDAGLVCTHDALVAALARGDTTVLDARPPGRFKGVDPEPRAGLASCGDRVMWLSLAISLAYVNNTY